MKKLVLLTGVLLTSSVAHAADLGVADLPRIHSEYEANQARWAQEFLNKTFSATLPLGRISNLFGNDKFAVAFMEKSSDWTPGVYCQDVQPSEFIISKNKGDIIFFRGTVEDHSFGSLDLRDCEFFNSESEAAEADRKAEAKAQADVEAKARAEIADEAARRQAEVAANQQNSVAAAAYNGSPEPAPVAIQSALDPRRSLSNDLNEIFRNMLRSGGKRCKAITDHVWVSADHISLMCDRRLRVAFFREGNVWRIGRPGE